ncbi:MAG: methylmalonyl-CoA epimerase [Chloroflexi bacterium]|jgi:methylmalonyl-CoA/ethylmalonyl-CoA epimerase|nr:methylmalonyl-CoA epimerase [Chloroflexota bacterium]
MIKRIDHVAIAVNNIDDAVASFEKLFGIKPAKIEDVPDQGVKAALIHIGDTELEFIQPIKPDTGVAKFLENKGEGIHHICIEVDDTDEELKRIEGEGGKLIDKEGRKGLAGKIGFIHPKSVNGVLIELAQKV